ncbi:hypothetical protein BDV27DRAFT_155181 [Aspergillus caelatus]|uniref:D-alanine--D-alanine ligase C-terminal domain-containing protein n=2 Tax=Aspergillus subgen. Circumdati TaxID=2720871 RepID=A0A5N7ABK6_9EURO|nr:uncharacterized protein BDV27DRAFT_155181 [Aspergillus caelatus]KAE8367212.1 hypothetical protein BDV27DRAFT_155181 [Aspergillus caelatus]KAE8418191.1 hypothetical protein BDV36DRAFT_295412 [Aspergillus pseudocaelatus]
MVLQHYGVPTAPFVVLHLDDEEELTPEKIQKTIDNSQHAKSLSKYPLFAKPLAEGSSKGIQTSNKIRNASELYPAIQDVRASTVSSSGILIEAFLSGREFTVGLLGTGKNAWVVGVTEMVWKGQKRQDGALDENIAFTTERSKANDDWDGIVDEEIDQSVAI